MTAPPDGPRGDGPDGWYDGEGRDGDRPADRGHISADGRDAGAPLPADIVVPDDASELELDRLALLRERALERRKARLQRLLFTRRWHSHGISGPIVVLCLVIVSIFAALLALLVPSGGNRAEPAQPLATSTVAPGQLGSRLPSETLLAAGRDAPNLATEALRPGVVLLLPAACSASAANRRACSLAISDVTGVARDYRYQTWLVGAVGDKDLPTLAETTSEDTYAVPLGDPTGRLLSAFPSRATPTAVFVDAHGLVQAVVAGLGKDTSVTAILDRLSGRA